MFVGKMPSMRSNLAELYAKASPDDRSLGRAWYPKAHYLMQEWAIHYGYDVGTVACVTAALSPQVEWGRNLIVANDLLAGRPPSIGGVIQSNILKAQRILRDRAHQTLDYFPQGPKVASFACNLAGDFDWVTVDTHAMQAALNDVQASYRLNWTRYATFAEVYRRAALEAGEEPAIFQAIIWHYWKRTYPRTYKLMERRQWHVVGEL